MLKEEKCPYCSASLEYDENNFSGEVECKYCHTKTTVIQVGEYVKSTDGFIAKVEEIDEDFIDFDSPIIIGYDGLCSYFGRDQLHFIVKHSFNIIDLIEEGDYVNGTEVGCILKDELGNITDVCYYDEVEGQTYSLGDIKSVVTHEQMKAMEYEVK